MSIESETSRSGAKQARNARIKERIQRTAPFILTLALLVMMFAQWMDARERRAQLEGLQARINQLQVEINKARARVDHAGTAR